MSDFKPKVLISCSFYLSLVGWQGNPDIIVIYRLRLMEKLPYPHSREERELQKVLHQ